MSRIVADEQCLASAARPHLPPELLLKVFGYVGPDRTTLLALRSVCRTFRNLVDRYGDRHIIKLFLFVFMQANLCLRVYLN